MDEHTIDFDGVESVGNAASPILNVEEGGIAPVLPAGELDGNTCVTLGTFPQP